MSNFRVPLAESDSVGALDGGRGLELGVVVELEADLDHQVQLVCVLRQPLDGHDVRFNLANHPDRPVEDLSDGEGVGQRQA